MNQQTVISMTGCPEGTTIPQAVLFKTEREQNTHSDETLIVDFEQGYNCYTSFGDRHGDQAPQDSVLNAAFQCGYETAMDI